MHPPDRPSSVPRPGMILRLLDTAMIAGIVGSVAFLVWRTPVRDSPDLIPSTLFADSLFVILGILLVRALRGRGRSPSTGLRAFVGLVTLVLGGMAFARLGLLRYEQNAEHPVALAGATIASVSGSALTAPEAAEWAVRVALHAASDPAVAGTVLEIPASWPLPAGAILGVRELPDGGREIWARAVAGEETSTCHARVTAKSEESDGTELIPRCDATDAVPPGLVLAPPHRSADTSTRPSAATGATPWLQHRGDAQRTASVESGDSVAATWHTTTPTRIRTSASVAGEYVLIGGHGSGLLVALDRSTGKRRWSARLPNWIHQAPVSDGQILAVGFGDNDRSFGGHAPSGVATYDLVTGRRLWTAFENGSVMTSPAIHDSLVTYATSSGVLRERRLTTGILLGSQQLPGEVIMGPPVLTGDTLVITLDGSRTCAVDLVPLHEIWCREQRGLRMLGHGSAAIDAGIVVVSGVATAVTPSLRNLLAMPLTLQGELLRALLFPQYLDYRTSHFAGQVFTGLDLGTGAVIWRSPFFERRRLVDGHTAGTAALQGGYGVIVLPVADTVVGFSTQSGAVQWSSGANGARGAPLIVGNQVLVAGRNGVIELRGLQDGALECTIRRDIGWDRAGPVVSGGLVIFANLDGEIEAIPTSDLLGCRAPGSEAAPR